MEKKRHPKLPRGLRWHAESQYIWFTWRDARGAQHQKSAETNDPAKALLFKLQFLEEQKQRQEQPLVEGPNLKKEPLSKVAALYFDWKGANNSSSTVAREKRIFKNVERLLGPDLQVRAIKLHQIREHQKQRREQTSPTMKQLVTARTVNYEIQLLRSVIRVSILVFAVDIGLKSYRRITYEPADLPEWRPFCIALMFSHAPIAKLVEGHLKNLRDFFLRVHSEQLVRAAVSAL